MPIEHIDINIFIDSYSRDREMHWTDNGEQVLIKMEVNYTKPNRL